jgi:hypothetical protein
MGHTRMEQVRVEDAALFAAPPWDRLVPVKAGYQTAPILEAFNWSYTLSDIEWGRWYLIVFRSVRHPDVDHSFLTAHDDVAFAEALRSGGLLRYYKGAMDRDRHCVSLCLCEKRRQAQVATALPDHERAAQLTNRFYESYDVERYILRKRKGFPDPEVVTVGGYRHRPRVGFGPPDAGRAVPAVTALPLG